MMKDRHLHDKAMQMKSDNMFCSQTQNKKLKQFMMLSKLWASFPSLTDWCNRCSLWSEALCPDKSGSQRARAHSLFQQPALFSFLTSLPSCPSCVYIYNCSFCLSVRTNWEVWGGTDKPAITEQSQQEVMAPPWPVGAFVQWEERAPGADTTFTAQITNFLLTSVPSEVDPVSNICKIKLLAGPINLTTLRP